MGWSDCLFGVFESLGVNNMELTVHTVIHQHKFCKGFHRFSVQTAKYSQESKYPQFKSPGCLCLQCYILESDFGLECWYGLLHGEAVHAWRQRKTHGGTWPPLSGQPGLQQTCKRHLLVPVRCRAGDHDVPCSTNFCPTFPAAAQGTEARTRNSAN